MPKPPHSSDVPVVSVAVGLTVAALLTLSVPNATLFIAFVLLTACSDLLEVKLPTDARFSLGLAPALGFALLGSSLSASILVFATGVGIAMLVRRALRRDAYATESCAHLLSLAGAGAVYHLVERVGGLPLLRADSETARLSIVGIMAVFVTVLAVETTINAMRTATRDRIPAMPLVRGLVRSSAPLHLALLSVSALLALAYPSLHYWSFPLILAPLAATQYAFRQFESIRRTYLQTIRALSKVPEMAGYSNEGHSARVAELSVAVARELGMSEEHVTEIEYAALLHDIGRVSIPDPEEVDRASQSELARVGAAIVRQTGHFPRVADMIERQHEIAHVAGDVELGARIIHATSAYDDLTRSGGIGLSADDALERLGRGAVGADPSVVVALGRVLAKRRVA